MNKAVNALLVAGLCLLGIAFIASSPGTSAAQTTTSIVGWLAPSGAQWNVGIPVLIFALAGVALFSMMARFLDLKNIGSFALLGLFVGSLLGILSLGNSTAGNVTPFGLIVIAGVDLVLYLWRGED